jgi:hypothetical protein
VQVSGVRHYWARPPEAADLCRDCPWSTASAGAAVA